MSDTTFAAPAASAPSAENPGPLSLASAATAPMTLYVCTTCRDAEDRLATADGPRAGARLHAAIAAVADDPAVTIVPVECLSVCTRTCAVGFAAPGKWTYVYGDLPADTAAATILRGARLYAEASDGLVPWRLRPDALKKGVISRVPPLPLGPLTLGLPALGPP